MEISLLTTLRWTKTVKSIIVNISVIKFVSPLSSILKA